MKSQKNINKKTCKNQKKTRKKEGFEEKTRG